MSTYPHRAIYHYRADNDVTWADVVEHFDLDATAKQIRQAHHGWLDRNEHVPESERRSSIDEQTVHARLPEEVRSIEDLERMFNVDPELWEVKRFPVKAYPVQLKGGVLYQGATVSAEFVPNREKAYALARSEIETALEAFKDHDPYDFQSLTVNPAPAGNQAAFVNTYDVHLGMLAYGKETEGEDWDLNTAGSDYIKSSIHQIDIARVYPISEINVVVGHDLGHINFVFEKSGKTAQGTPQDFDSRLSKIRTTAREVAVEVIDYAMTLGIPVNVWMVPGNHDPDFVYALGEVLYAWYRNVDQVTVHYSPSRHRRHLFGKNSILMTHGERSQAKARSLPMKALATMPDEHRLALVRQVIILSGHLHTEKRGQYVPSGEVDSEMNVVVYNLKGLTPSDAWHEQQDYGHVRGSDLLIVHEDGGVVAQHTYFPHIHG